MANLNHGAAAPILATRSHAFYSYNPEHDCLFSVRPGVPADDALNMASCFLDVAGSLVCRLGEDYDSNSAHAADYMNSAHAADHMITQAKALIDALDLGEPANDPRSSVDYDRRRRDVIERMVCLFDEGAFIVNPAAGELAAKDAQRFLEWAARESKGGAE